MNIALVIPAAGRGERLGLGVPKALVPLGGVALLRRTADRMAAAAKFAETVVLAPEDSIDAFEEALRGASPLLGRLRVLAGGATRQASVAAGLAALAPGVDLVCIHDAARPLVSAQTVGEVILAAHESGAATAAARPSDSVRQDRGDGGSVALDRSSLWLVETPQVFRRSVIEQAHRHAAASAGPWTDDASMVEAIGQPIRVVASEGRNLKVTVEADLALALEMLRREAVAP